MNEFGLLGIGTGIGVAASFFLATYLLVVRKDDQFNRYILAFLFIAIALRVGKSIVFYIYYDVSGPGLALGYLGLSSIGPLTYLYLTHQDRVLTARDLIHFLIPLSLTLACLFLNLDWVTILYKSTTGAFLLYLMLSWFKAAKLKVSPELTIWNKKVLTAVSVIGLAFVYQHLSESMMAYAIGAGIAAIAIYYLLFQALKMGVIATRTRTFDISDTTLTAVKLAFEEHKLYLSPGITLSKASEKLDIPSYLITKAVRQLYNRSFPDAVNFFRIETVKRMLDQNYQLKIEGMGYEVGYNTPSAFYAAFKKQTGLSPKEYQKSQELKPAV